MPASTTHQALLPPVLTRLIRFKEGERVKTSFGSGIFRQKIKYVHTQESREDALCSNHHRSRARHPRRPNLLSSYSISSFSHFLYNGNDDNMLMALVMDMMVYIFRHNVTSGRDIYVVQLDQGGVLYSQVEKSCMRYIYICASSGYPSHTIGLFGHLQYSCRRAG